MDPCISKEHEGTGRPSRSSPAKDEFSHEELLRLIRRRDFVSLLLSYPGNVAEESILKAWLSDVSKWTAHLFSGSGIRELSGLLTENPLRYVEGLLPLEIIREIEDGGSSNFNNSDVTPIPEAILDLAVDLAVGQLIQTLLSEDDYVHNIHYVRLSTRNDIEKKAVVEKIEAVFKNKHNVVGIHKAFRGALWIDASMYQSAVEVRVQEEIAQQLKHMTTTGVGTEEDEVLRTVDTEEEIVSNRYLVLIVDGDGSKKLDPQKVHFPRMKFCGIVVLITTEPSELGIDDFTLVSNLNIRTQDHLLPWRVLCSYATSSIVRSSSAIQRLAVQIVEECRGHLLSVVLVANSLKNVEDVKLWELALDKLCYTNPSNEYQESYQVGISRVMVNAFVNIIWEGINKAQKLCLELSLFHPNIKDGVPGEILISDWVTLELAHTQEAAQHLLKFDSADTKLEYEREEAERDMIELLDRFVFLQCGSSFIRLPNETYVILESLHNTNPSFIRDGALGLMEPPHIGRWHAVVRIELMDNELCELPQSPNCPKLKVLLLQGNVNLTEIPNLFFDQMPLLRYLDLSYTSIRDLPPSFFNLHELRKFNLKGCELFTELPPEIGQLKALEKLDLDGTLVTHAPSEIQELTNLQSMTLCFYGYHHKFGSGKKGKQCSNSTIIPPGVISNLTQLNFLSINVDPDDERWYANVVIILPEIFALGKLETVLIYVPKTELLDLIPTRSSLDFRLVVGHHMQRFISRAPPAVEETFKASDCSLKFVYGVDVPNEVNMILERSKALYLDRHMTIKSLSEFQSKNLDMLQVCILAECNEMEAVINGSYSYDGHCLPYLKFLCLLHEELKKHLRRAYSDQSLLFTCLEVNSIAHLPHVNNYLHLRFS